MSGGKFLGAEVESRVRINDASKRDPTEAFWKFWSPLKAPKNRIRPKNTTSERGNPGPRNTEVSLFFSDKLCQSWRESGGWGIIRPPEQHCVPRGSGRVARPN